MRLVFFGFPARSHTVPSLALMRELVARGTEVEYHSTEPFRSLIESIGARFVEYPSLCEQLADPAGLTAEAGVAAHAERVAVVSEHIAPGLLASIRHPDLVAFDASAYWGHLLARRLRSASFAFVTTFAWTRSMLQLLGIRDTATLDILLPPADLRIVCTSRSFQPSGRFFNDSYMFVGPLLDQRPSDGVRIKMDGSRPLAYVSLGTIFNRDRELLRRIAAVLSDAGWQVAVALGNAAWRDSAEDTANAWPPHVRVYPFVNQMAALAVADLAVTHGGMASVSEILASRIPSIVVPQGVDQFLVARHAASLGAAIVVDPAADFESSWRAALKRLREERLLFAATASRIASCFSDVTPIACAADRVLQLVRAETNQVCYE